MGTSRREWPGVYLTMQQLQRTTVERKPKARNIYADSFAAKYELHYGMPYVSTQADYVQLATLFNKLGTRLTVEVWDRGCANYFASELGMHTLKHLCTQFVPYWKSPLDRFGKVKENRPNGTRTGMRSIAEMAGLPWQFRFAARVNAAYDAHPVPERAKALEALFDQMEDEQLGEAEAIRRLEIIEKS